MTRRRWIADEFSGDRAALLGDHANHLIKVLRARVGQEFDIAAGETVRRGRITSLDHDRVEFELGEDISGAASAGISLLLAIFKFDRMEWAIEKCTELGVSKIVPVIAQRTDSHLAAAAIKRVERWQRIARQAAEQSRQITSPEITAPVKLAEATNFSASLRIVLSESEERTLVRDILRPVNGDAGIALAIGPEGGWTTIELDHFQKSNWIAASLGNTILRAETAAIAATAIVVSAHL